MKIDKILQANNILDRIINHQANCDFKSSIMLGFIGILVSCFFMSSFFCKIIDIFNARSSFTIQILILLLLLIGTYQVIMSLYYLLETLKGRLDPTKIKEDKKEGLITNGSTISFGHISQQSYKDFENKMNMDEDSFDKDLLSQIYINSRICMRKFSMYNKALNHITYTLIAILLLVISIFIHGVI